MLTNNSPPPPPGSCPRSLDCARAGRHFCPLGGTQCGPCLGPLVEDPHGRCMVRGRKAHHYAKKTTYPELDEEIDFLSTIVTEQRVTKSRKPGINQSQASAKLNVAHALLLVETIGKSNKKTLGYIGFPFMTFSIHFAPQPGDKKLAHSAQMYHYQHQRQQMLSLEKHRGEPKIPDYACPGLAPTGEMEVKNPLFDDSTLYLQRFPQ
uniref:Neural proliferation, differentiation and control, 1b n=1 Tax=Gadus morhua TaxID=8049 RepID=A0A8C5C402_GADMO